MTKISEQQQWNRYVNAINFCIRQGYYILPIMSRNSGNCRAIRVRTDDGLEETTIPLEPRKYKSEELLNLIREKL